MGFLQEEKPRGPAWALALALGVGLWGCAPPPPSLEDLRGEVQAFIGSSGAEVGLYYRSLEGADSLLVSPDLRMHAASTMKVPVMIQLYLDHQAGLLNLEDSLEVTTSFRSIVDGSPYDLTAGSDSDSTLYARAGTPMGYHDLIELMITVSSNLATNILIDVARGDRVTASMRALGADSIQVLRGVEDIPAFRAGLSNTTTARDLGVILGALARGEVGSPDLSNQMIAVMARQHFRTQIPAQLPPGTRVAHKTGTITGIHHDAGIVYPQGASPYVLVILTRGFEEEEAADGFMARLSRMVFDYHVARPGP